MARTRTIMRWIMSAFYLLFGTLHLTVPEAMLPMMPDVIPFPREVIMLTGLCEIAGALALFSMRLRTVAGVMLAIYALCVWPANIKHAVQGISVPGIPDTWWYHAPRLALQPVIIWWALFCSGAIDWPLRTQRHSD